MQITTIIHEVFTEKADLDSIEGIYYLDKEYHDDFFDETYDHIILIILKDERSYCSSKTRIAFEQVVETLSAHGVNNVFCSYSNEDDF